MYKKYIFVNLILVFLCVSISYSKDSIIYSDYLNTDEDKNVLAKGNVRILHGEEIINSESVYIDEVNQKIILENEFTYKDKAGNYYYGSKGEFSKDFTNGEINDFSFIGVEKLRLRGVKGIKRGNVDIVEKGVITPCRTLKFLNCPLWQIEAQKLVHDKNEMMIYQKHSRLELLNIPVFYTPYSISPSPLRKERRSGFLYPTFILMNSRLGGNAKLPYYVNISHDKELLITPIIYYQKDEQNIQYFYNQKTPGGKIVANATTLTSFNKTDDLEWLKDASLSLTVTQNINHNYKSGFNLNTQTRGTYIREYDSSNPINYFTSLSTNAFLDGYSIIEKDDLMMFETYNFQAVREGGNNKEIPAVWPVINYNTGTNLIFEDINLQNKFLFYHIHRDKNTKDHAYRQTRLNLDTDLSYQKFWKNSRMRFESTIQSDFYSTFKKQIENEFVSDEHVRIFPMTGVLIDHPFVNTETGTIYNPKFFLGINGSRSNTIEISNELTTDNELDLSRFFSVNRYTGNDKYDNGQRIGYGFDIDKENFYFDIAQGYQLSDKSDYSKDVNMFHDYSDIVGRLGFSNFLGSKYDSGFNYNYRYSPSDKYIYYQAAGLATGTPIGNISINYVNANSKSSSLNFSDRENISLGFQSNSILEYSTINVSGSYNMITNRHQISTINYNYGDECFALGATYSRNFFEKMPDTLGIGMSFTFIGPVPPNIIDKLFLTPLNFSEDK